MPNPNCTSPISCPGSDNPILNLSSEAPDHFVFIGVQWKPGIPPPVNRIFTNNGCLGICTSTISQDDADQCAARQAVMCVGSTVIPNCPDCPAPPPPTIVCSNPASCTVNCPDGLPFTFNVPAGLYCGSSQTAVDNQAHQYACKLAPLFQVCIGNFQQCVCTGLLVDYHITVTSPAPVTLSIVGGSLPPGVLLRPDTSSASGWSLIGVPNTPGTYFFSVKAITSTGLFMVKALSMVVLQIQTVALPNFQIGVPYDFTLRVVGGSGNYAWKILSGTLPNGLIMEINGRIHGTPM